MTQEFWDDLYREHGQRWSGNANAQLVDLVQDLTPGTALDLGCGEGGDSRWLAQRGWRVTGVDISEVALDRARQVAAEEGLDLDLRRVDLSHDDLLGTFDLVSACFLQSPVELDRAGVLAKMAAAVNDGGHLVLVDHAEPPPGSDHPEHLFPTIEDNLRQLGADDGWDVLVAEKRTRQAVRDGKDMTLVDGVVLLRRSTTPA